jgi:hypothetical protein
MPAEPRARVGAPAKPPEAHAKAYTARLYADDRAALARCAQALGVNESAALRTAIHQLAQTLKA